MDFPFTRSQIKKYLMMYGGIVLLMVLFYLANAVFSEPKETVEKKTFESTPSMNTHQSDTVDKKEEEASKDPRFKVLDKAY